MKTPAVLAAVLLVASPLFADNQPVTPPAPSPAVTNPTAGTPAPPKPVDPKAAPPKPPVKKPEPVPVIPGLTINRADGTFLGLEVINGNFVLSFYDKKKKPMAPDVARATARWPNLKSATTGYNRAVLNPGGGNALVGNRPVIPPLSFIVFLSLLQGDGDDAKVVESYSIQFHG